MRQATKSPRINADYLDRGLERFRSVLRARELKLSKVRDAVARCALSRAGHFSVEDIVNNLKQQPDAVGEVPKTLQGIRHGFAAMGAEQYGGTYQCTGLADVHEFEFADGQLLANRREVDGLAAGHAA